jgi:hypothetical protein
VPACIEHLPFNDAASAHIVPRVRCDHGHPFDLDLEGEGE